MPEPIPLAVLIVHHFVIWYRFFIEQMHALYSWTKHMIHAWSIPMTPMPPMPPIHRPTPFTTQDILKTIRAHKTNPTPLTSPASFFQYCQTYTLAEDKTAYNSNMDVIFYNPELFTEAVMHSTEEVSRLFVRKWLRRKIHCQIGDYSIFMVYNPKRMAFQYSSDFTVPYDILNQAAMIYVTQFRCLDLFQDTRPVPSFRSPLIDLHEKYKFEVERQHRENAESKISHHISRTAMLERYRRAKPTSAEPPPEFVSGASHSNSFYKMRAIQEEWNESIRIAQAPALK